MAHYALEPYKWGASGLGTSGGSVTYSFATANYADQQYTFDASLSVSFQAEVRLAFERWEEFANIDFVEVADDASNDLRLGFDYIDGLGNTVGEAYTVYNPQTGVVIEAEIRFETDENWTTSNNRIVTGSGSSFYAIALHEIGHTMGLDHYTESVAIMNPVISTSDLTSSDIHGIQAVYGPSSLSGVFDTPFFALAAFGSSAGGWTNNEVYRRDVADINGDRRADIVGFGADGTFVSLARSDGSFGQMYQANNSFGAGAAGGGWSTDDRYHRDMADVNGDGRADIIGFGAAGTYVALGTAAGGFTPTSQATNTFGSNAAAGGWSSQDIYTRQIGDVNGDGRADIVGFGSAGAYVSLGTSGGSFAPMFLSTNSFGATAQAGGWNSDRVYHRELADVNGDGRADIVGFGSAGVYVALATGNGNFGSQFLAVGAFGTSANAGGWSNQDLYPRHLADVNDDGRADIVGFGDSFVFIATGRTDGTFNAPVPDIAAFGSGAQAGGWSSDNLYPRVLADVNADGAADILGFSSAGVYLSHSELG